MKSDQERRHTGRNRWWAPACLLAVAAVGALTTAACAREARPNILFLFTDDQRHDTIGALGNASIRTPHMDRLVRDGVTFTNAYIMGGSSPAVCSPSRACLFSGRTLWNIENQGMWGYEISEQFPTLPQVFRENGYATFGTGKNEPGRAGHFARSFSAGGKILFRGMTGSQYKLPLCPFSPDGDYSKKNEVLHTGKHSAEVYATITHTDAQIGRILEALEKTGKLPNTIIVFASDNGLAVGRHGLMGKQNVYDHSVHVPLVVAGPGIPRDERRDQLCYIYDIYPTLCERAGLETPDTVQFKSLNRVINNPDASHRDHLYFAFMSWQRAIRDRQFKLNEYCVDGQRHTQLFDLAADPEEIRNLAGEAAHAGTLSRLRNLLQLERVRLNDGHTPFPFADQQGKDFWTLYTSTDETVIP